MFERIRKAMQDALTRVGATAQLSREYKSIFDLDGVPAFSQFYNLGIFPWKYIYKGFYKPWHVIGAPTIADPNAKRNLAYLSLAKAVCAELAGMVWTDQCDVDVSMTGREGEDEDPLCDFVREVLRQNNFQQKMQETIEQAAALGGAALKVWREAKHDQEGNEIEGTGRIRIGYAMADQFVPVAWDNATISEGIFVSRQAKGGWYYTRLEWHQWDGLTYVITNELYRAEMEGRSGEAQDILGFRYPLAELYPYLDEETRINVEESLFSYFRTPIANNIDDNSPLGVSMYANALETLHAIDVVFDSFVREFRLGKKRIIVPARMIRQVTDPATGKMVRYFDANDETYEALSTDDPDTLRIQDNSVELRVEEHVAAMNAFLNIFCLQVGLSAGTFSFDAASGLKTATEVVSENSKTYKTVKSYQHQIAPAVEKIVDAIITVAQLYDMDYEGTKISALASRGYEVKVSMDDGITQDRQTNINEGITLVGAGLMSKRTFLTDPKYGQNLTEEDAEAELQRIAQENTVTLPRLDVMDYNGAE